jgi:hypothetical protein
MEYSDALARAVKAIDPSSAAGQVLRSTAQLHKHPTRSYHANGCSEITGYGFKPVPVVIMDVLLSEEYYCEFCSLGVDGGTGVLGTLIDLAESVQDDLKPSAARWLRERMQECLTGDLEPLMGLVEEACAKSAEFHALVVPHAFEVLDLLSSLEVFNRAGGTAVSFAEAAGASSRLMAAGLSAGAVELLKREAYGPAAPENSESRLDDALELHRTRERVAGEVLLAAPHTGVFCSGLRSLHLSGDGLVDHALEALALPGHPEVGIFPASLVPALLGRLAMVKGVKPMSTEGLTSEVLETFLVLRANQDDVSALAAAKALA